MKYLGSSPVLPALMVICIWGINVCMIKVAVQDMTPALFTAMRFLLLTIFLFPFRKIPKESRKDVLKLSLTMGIGHFLILSIALSYVDSTTAAMIIILGAPISSLVAFFFLNERLTRLQMAALFVAAAGAISPILVQKVPQIRLGALFMLLSMTIWAFGNLQVRKINNIKPLTINFWIGAVTAPFCFLVYFVGGDLRPLHEVFTLKSTLATLYVVLFSSVLAYYLWYRLINTHGVSNITIYTLLQPFVTTLAGYLILNETFSRAQMIGALVTIMAVYVFFNAGTLCKTNPKAD
ncbi:DMT family transporter [Desulforapulum autotrophicum]|uniref:DMT family transporter n=1 Tax=Desulforapulum autotrophicum TaxID=2296 RepID=UPI00059D4547|nr:DMT family transporter [Desulforapulum autotrophicum]